MHTVCEDASIIKKREQMVKLEGTAAKKFDTTFKKQSTPLMLNAGSIKKLGGTFAECGSTFKK